MRHRDNIFIPGKVNSKFLIVESIRACIGGVESHGRDLTNIRGVLFEVVKYGDHINSILSVLFAVGF